MTGERWFCVLCGNLTAKGPRPGRPVLCRAHENIVVDFIPPDPLQSLPMQAATTHGEDLNPAAGTERC